MRGQGVATPLWKEEVLTRNQGIFPPVQLVSGFIASQASHWHSLSSSST
jgi:hypothetical protein